MRGARKSDSQKKWRKRIKKTHKSSDIRFIRLYRWPYTHTSIRTNTILCIKHSAMASIAQFSEHTLEHWAVYACIYSASAIGMRFDPITFNQVLILMYIFICRLPSTATMMMTTVTTTVTTTTTRHWCLECAIVSQSQSDRATISVECFNGRQEDTHENAREINTLRAADDRIRVGEGVKREKKNHKTTNRQLPTPISE